MIDCETESLSIAQSVGHSDPIILLKENDEHVERNITRSSRKEISYSSDVINERDAVDTRSLHSSGVSAMRNVSKLRSKFPFKAMPTEISQVESKCDAGDRKLIDSCSSLSEQDNKESEYNNIGSSGVNNNFSKVRNRLQAARDETYFLDDNI